MWTARACVQCTQPDATCIQHITYHIAKTATDHECVDDVIVLASTRTLTPKEPRFAGTKTATTTVIKVKTKQVSETIAGSRIASETVPSL